MDDTIVYEGLYRLDTFEKNGLPDKANIRDISFIRVKIPHRKKLLFFPYYENWRPISLPEDFIFPKDLYKNLRNWEKNPRMFMIKFEAKDCGRIQFWLRMIRQVEITKIHEINEVKK
ncbi:MAG: hypothetical protein COA79_11790 [Planctomycetota bacterium]|nr:MAG: hypothetical protein COA79_11790 [Planctomycetota bacterium]